MASKVMYSNTCKEHGLDCVLYLEFRMPDEPNFDPPVDQVPFPEHLRSQAHKDFPGALCSHFAHTPGPLEITVVEESSQPRT